MHAFYSDTFVLPLPAEHRFPMPKYSRLRERILEAGILPAANIHVAEPATDEQLLRAHDADYIEKVRLGLLSAQEQRRVGFPWTPALAVRARCTVGATIMACRAALEMASRSGFGVACNLAGGTHHAYRDHGQGYCVFNDSAVAARAMQAEGRARRVVVIDCDVHQGNGTAAIFQGDPTVFTFSIHGAKNFPFHKEKGDLDIELPDNTTDADYLAAVEEGARRAIAVSGADLALYLAGADPFERDRLGRMKVTMAGLAERDQIVLGLCREAGLPVSIAMAGGYAPDVEDVVAIHLETIRAAASFAAAAERGVV